MFLEMSFYEEAIFCKEQQESREMIDKKQNMFKWLSENVTAWIYVCLLKGM